MSLTTSNTKCLLITTRSTSTGPALIVQIDGRSVEQVDYAKLLGVILDSGMSWKQDIDTIWSIISCRHSPPSNQTIS